MSRALLSRELPIFLLGAALVALSWDASPQGRLTGVQAISAGGGTTPDTGYHTCAVTGSGTAYCWGQNFTGQLGDGTSLSRPWPSEVAGFSSGVAGIQAAADFGGLGHTCALTSGGGVKCWGYNYYGGIGDGTLVDKKTPQDVVGLGSGATAVAGGEAMSCAVNAAGGVVCWGITPEGWKSAPVAIAGLASGVASISARGNACVVTTTGAAKCWGSAQFGTGYPPTDVVGLSSGVAAVTVGGYHSCVLMADGKVKCWGGAGSNGSESSSDVPVDVAGLPAGIRALSAGFSHTCALTAEGGVKCWGANANGQLGDGTTTGRWSPGDVVGLGGPATAISAGASHTCAVLSTGEAQCWGSNFVGELGDGTLVARLTPGYVVAARPPPPPPPSAPSLAPASDTGVSPTDGITNHPTPTFTGTCATGVSVNLHLNGTALEPAVDCVGGTYSITVPPSTMVQGPYEIRATARTAEGESSPSPPLFMQVDYVVPNAQFTCTPPATADSAQSTFCFTATDTGPGVPFLACSLDGAAFGTCTSPVSLAALVPGAHAFSVRATDLAGNVQATPATFNWTVAVDTTPDAFAFPPAVDVVPGATATSEKVVINGINVPTPVSVSGGSFAIACVEPFVTVPGTVLDGQEVCVRHVAGAAQTTVTTTLTVGGVQGSFTSNAIDVIVSPRSVNFGARATSTTSLPIGVSIRNQTTASVPVLSVTTAAPFAVTHDCGALAPEGTCIASVTFTPPSLGAHAGELVVETAAGKQRVALTGSGGGASMVEHYYRTLLRREPDAEGLAFWMGEFERVSGLGADGNEVFYAMAQVFLASPEYLAFQRNDEGFVTDLYRAFFVREPDVEGLAYWVGQLGAIQSRSALVNSFLFSPEFIAFTTPLFGAQEVRAEVNLAMDLFRGTLGRLPDSDGFNYWLGEIRKAQCLGANAVSFAVGSIADLFFHSPEYLERLRYDRDFVGDVYNTYLRRGPGGDAAGFNFWVSRVPAPGGRDEVRRQFVPSTEFQNRVAAVVAAGCLTP